MSTSLLHMFDPEIRDQEVVYRGELRPPAHPAHQIEFRASVPAPPGDLAPVRPFLFAFLIPAMRLGTALQLPRPIDATTLANVMEWQEAMASWRPHVLKVVPIHADIEPDRPRTGGNGGAITAFSGGVDSCFTVVRQTALAGPAMYRRVNLRAGVMVHGFDIPTSQPEVFESAWQNSEALLGAFGLRAFRLKTNLRSMVAAFGCDWETEVHGIWLAAALACYEPWFERVVIPSTYTYPRMLLPWGSNPVTDPLFASDRVEFLHDGAAFTKFTKVRAMASCTEVARRVRVCWEGARLDRNCGHCFKCVATQVCFWVSGVPAPPAFPQPATIHDVAGLPIKNEINAYLVRSLQAAAEEQGQDELGAALKSALRRGVWTKKVKRWKHLVRSAARRVGVSA